MSKLVSKIIDKCNVAKREKLNILIHEFDIETELKISETGHNFYRINISDKDTDRYTDNFFILPKDEILFCFDYDLILFKNGTISEQTLNDLNQQLQVPIIVIDDNDSFIKDNFEVTNVSDPKSENFVQQWTNILKRYV